MKDSIKCICSRDKERRVGTREYFIHDMKILIHNTPIFCCESCDSASVGFEVGDVERLLRIAFRLRIKELDFNYRNNQITVVFNISVEEETRQNILSIISQNEINDEETFAIMYGSRIIVGQRLDNFIAIEKLIEKVI